MSGSVFSPRRLKCRVRKYRPLTNWSAAPASPGPSALSQPARRSSKPTAATNSKQHLDGLFRDTYAHLAATGFWNARQQGASGREGAVARQRFAQWQADTLEAIQTLADSGSLRQLDTAFVAKM